MKGKEAAVAVASENRGPRNVSSLIPSEAFVLIIIAVILGILIFRWVASDSDNESAAVAQNANRPSCEAWRAMYPVLRPEDFPIDTIRIGDIKRVGRILKVGPRERWLVELSDSAGVVEFTKNMRGRYELTAKTWVASLDYPPLGVWDEPGKTIEWGLRRFFEFRGKGCVLLAGGN